MIKLFNIKLSFNKTTVAERQKPEKFTSFDKFLQPSKIKIIKNWSIKTTHTPQKRSKRRKKNANMLEKFENL